MRYVSLSRTTAAEHPFDFDCPEVKAQLIRESAVADFGAKVPKERWLWHAEIRVCRRTASVLAKCGFYAQVSRAEDEDQALAEREEKRRKGAYFLLEDGAVGFGSGGRLPFAGGRSVNGGSPIVQHCAWYRGRRGGEGWDSEGGHSSCQAIVGGGRRGVSYNSLPLHVAGSRLFKDLRARDVCSLRSFSHVEVPHCSEVKAEPDCESKVPDLVATVPREWCGALGLPRYVCVVALLRCWPFLDLCSQVSPAEDEDQALTERGATRPNGAHLLLGGGVPFGDARERSPGANGPLGSPNGPPNQDPRFTRSAFLRNEHYLPGGALKS